jgi:hypothetical protein
MSLFEQVGFIPLVQKINALPLITAKIDKQSNQLSLLLFELY